MKSHQHDYSLPSSKDERLEARVTADQKKIFQHAADLIGINLSAFIISSLQEAANRAIQNHEMIQLSMRDLEVFAKAFINPPEPNARLMNAAKRHKKLIKRSSS